MKIGNEVARQIVDSVKEVCGYNINFIEPDGTIAASTDPGRVGTYHEIGHKAAVTKSTLEVTDDSSYFGTQKGINMPVSWHGEIVAVIGISGDPDEVRKYAFLAQKITRLILREWELDAIDRNSREAARYLVKSLVHGLPVDGEFLRDFLEKAHHDFSPESRFQTVIVRTDDRYNPANAFLVEQDILRTFELIGSVLYTYEYPNEYILIAEKGALEQNFYLLNRLAEKFGILLRIGVGVDHSLAHQNRSYQEAEIAVCSRVDADENKVVSYNDIDLEILLAAVPEENKRRYVDKILGRMDSKTLGVLRSYLDADCHLKKAADSLFIHENTMKYQLKKVETVTGLDPRRFRDAVILSLAMSLKKEIT